MRGADLVAFNHFAEFPTGHNIGDATVLFDTAHDDFGNELAVAADQKLAVFENALILADVQHDKIPFRINHQNFAPEIGAQSDGGVRTFVFGKAVFNRVMARCKTIFSSLATSMASCAVFERRLSLPT
jgi:hypothetical protein